MDTDRLVILKKSTDAVLRIAQI